MKEGFGPPGTWDKMEAHLRGLSHHVGSVPKAILVISAHWEEERPTVMTNPNPSLLYDYYGFPDYTYRLEYPVPGSPDLADTVQQLLRAQGFDPAFDPDRGFDHGVFIPFMLIYPQANIPIIQLSLHSSLDPAYHIAMGQALAPLLRQGVLMVGSGLSFHNLRTFFNGKDDPQANAFDDWLNQTLTQDDPAKRNNALVSWKSAPGSTAAHPREEHLIPLMVIAGAADNRPATRIYQDTVLSKPVSSFLFA